LLFAAIGTTLRPTVGGADGVEFEFPPKLPFVTPIFFSLIFLVGPRFGFESIPLRTDKTNRTHRRGPGHLFREPDAGGF
jgi:hypothetical protein